MAAQPPVEVAKGLVNERVMALLNGETGGHANTAPLFVGMPLNHSEGSWLCSITCTETLEKLQRGMDPTLVLQGAFEWTLLVGMAAGLAAAESD